MSHRHHSDDPKLQARKEKLARHDHHVEHYFRRALHFIERFIAIITIVALLGALAIEISHMISSGTAYFADVNHMLHNLLTIVVGLEFVRMLLDMTPANTLEVLIVAIARQVIMTHDNPWSNLASVLCIAGLFATRRFLIPRGEMTCDTDNADEQCPLVIVIHDNVPGGGHDQYLQGIARRHVD